MRRLKAKAVGCVLPARRLYPDLLERPPAALQRARRCVQGQRRGRDRLPVGQRRLRHERMEAGSGGREHHFDSRRQRRVHGGHGFARRQAGSSIGFGKRSWRYSMLVKDGVIEKMFIEPEKEGDPFEVSDADTMLKYINSKVVAARPRGDLRRPAARTARAPRRCSNPGGLPATTKSPLGKHITSSTLRAVSGSGTRPQVHRRLSSPATRTIWKRISRAQSGLKQTP